MVLVRNKIELNSKFLFAAISIAVIISSFIFIACVAYLVKASSIGHMRYETHNGSATGWEWAATQSQKQNLQRPAIWSDVVSRIKITVVNRTSGVDKALTPIYQANQSTLTEPTSYWRIFNYVWKENPKHFDIEATAAIARASDGGYIVEISKLTQRGVKIDIDNGSRTIMIPTTNPNQVGPGFVAFEIPYK